MLIIFVPLFDHGKEIKMTSKSYPTDVLAQTQAVTEAWKKIDLALTIGELTPTSLAAELEQARQNQAQLDALDAQLTDVRNQRDALNSTLWEKVKRVRAGVKGIYGDDSSQYEMIGGTRLSERKPASRKSTA
jgi:hypothetical protein